MPVRYRSASDYSAANAVGHRLVQCVARLHDLGIVHCDIKPQVRVTRVPIHTVSTCLTRSHCALHLVVATALHAVQRPLETGRLRLLCARWDGHGASFHTAVLCARSGACCPCRLLTVCETHSHRHAVTVAQPAATQPQLQHRRAHAPHHLHCRVPPRAGGGRLACRRWWPCRVSSTARAGPTTCAWHVKSHGGSRGAQP